MRPGPLFAWGAAAGKPLRPAAVSGTPLPPALEAGIAPGGPAPGPGWRPGLPGAAERALQARDEGGIGAACLAGTQVAGQSDRAVADAQQAAHLETHRAPQPAHLAVAPLVQHDPEGRAALRTLVVRAFSADPIEARRAVLQLHAREELSQDLRPWPAAQTHPVLALHFARGVHEAVGERPVRRQQQQPCGVHVEASDGNPASAARWRQPPEHGRPALWVAAGGHLAEPLVIKE